MHEVIAPAGRILHSDIAIEHRKEKPGDPDRNLRIYQAMVDRGEALEPRAQYYYARELYYHAAYQQAADVFEAFLAEGRGWVENNIGACQDLSLCYHQLGKEEKALQALLRSFVSVSYTHLICPYISPEETTSSRLCHCLANDNRRSVPSKFAFSVSTGYLAKETGSALLAAWTI